jgi:Tetratricopeptide repeat
VVAHSLNYLGYALLDSGDPGGAEHLQRSAAIARAAHHYEYAQRAYTNLVEGLYRQGRFQELDEPIARGLAYAREYGFASHEYNLEAHRCMLLTLRGRWEEAEAGLRRLLAGEDPGVLASFGLCALGRLLARKGDPTARSRCSGCSPTGSPTRRSPTGWWCRSAPSTTTSPPS